jgi:hypothetical protein
VHQRGFRPFAGSSHAQFQRPYLIAAAYVLAVSWFIVLVFPTPPPRFMDVYLIGIIIACARWSVGPALVIYLASLAFASWILRPGAAVSEGYELYRMFSYSATAIVAIFVIGRLKLDKD